jgi:hypothetical protein
MPEQHIIEDPQEDDPDIWERLSIPCGGYNSTVDQQIYDAAKLIVGARQADGCIYCDDLAAKLSITPEHAELIQYILASVRYTDRPHLKDRPFTYGTSPRGLFVDDTECAERFLAEFGLHMKSWTKPE